MRSTILLLIGLAATTTPVHAQGLTRSECDEVVMAISEISRAAGGMLIHVENMNLATLRSGDEKLTLAVTRLEEARKSLISGLSEFTLAAKDVGQAVPG